MKVIYQILLAFIFVGFIWIAIYFGLQNINKEIPSSPDMVTFKGSQYLDENNMTSYELLEANGKSMHPTISENDLIIVRYDFNESELQIGSIIFVRSEEDWQAIVHRIVDIEENKITTKGDNNAVKDVQVWDIADVRGLIVGVLYQ